MGNTNAMKRLFKELDNEVSQTILLNKNEATDISNRLYLNSDSHFIEGYIKSIKYTITEIIKTN